MRIGSKTVLQGCWMVRKVLIQLLPGVLSLNSILIRKEYIRGPEISQCDLLKTQGEMHSVQRIRFKTKNL